MIYHHPKPDDLDAAGLMGWLGQAGKGEVLEYHRGHLAVDTDAACSRLAGQDRAALQELAACAYALCEAGLCHLVQQRNGDGSFSYLAVADGKIKKRAAAISALLGEEGA